MAILYVTEEAKAFFENLSRADNNRPTAQVVDLFIEKAKQCLNIRADATSSGDTSDANTLNGKSQQQSPVNGGQQDANFQ